MDLLRSTTTALDRPTTMALDRAYGDGRLVGFLGLATNAGCPFGADRPSLRIAWLDGFADGRAEARADGRQANDPMNDDWRAPNDNSEVSLADIAIAHLHRLLQQINDAGPQGLGGSPAYAAAGAFLSLVRTGQPDGNAAGGLGAHSRA